MRAAYAPIVSSGQPIPQLELLEWIPDGVIITDARGRIVFANRHAEELTGYRRRELVGKPIELLVPRSLRRAHRGHRGDFLTGHAGPRPMGAAEREFKLRRKDGTELSTDIALGTIDGPAGRQVVSVIRDFTEHRRLEAALEHQALHDPLTGLSNRTLFFDRLRQALSNARRDQRPLALVMIDLDDFKVVNDDHGHAVGDAVLRQLGARLGSGLRETDTAARIGGDEFALILPRISGRHDASRMVRRHMDQIEGTYPVGRRRIQIGASAGVALFPEDGADIDTLLRHADSAMYFAKREGRGVAFYPSGPGEPRQ